ncbi:hypothetical protein O3M35_002075 [Rhynocoris fuscipes]|uniref:Uncharacterized protein n=1 Tax=Rhynocoris fuscipes TaxID=488301 RepID=A0AAW1CQX2_9HEMI
MNRCTGKSCVGHIRFLELFLCQLQNKYQHDCSKSITVHKLISYSAVKKYRLNMKIRNIY